MTFEQLKNFIVISDFGNMSKAAEYLYIAQSTLSRQIAALETELGVVLFARGSSSFALTEAGRIVFEEAKYTINRWTDLSRQLLAGDKQLNTSLRIGIAGNYVNNSITGSYNNCELTAGVLNGNQFELKTEAQNPAVGTLEVTITGTVNGDEITGTVATPLTTGELTGIRE